MIECKIRARASLIEDGMDADEAEEAVQLPSSAETSESDDSSDRSSILCKNEEKDPGNPHELKKCFIYSLKRQWYTEEAAKKGYRSVLFYSTYYYRGTIKTKQERAKLIR